MSWTTRHLRGSTALAECGPAFDDLCAELDVPVTSRRPWLQAWVDSYPCTPWVVLVERDGQLRAAAPLALRRHGPLTRVSGLGHGPTDDLRLPAVDAEAAERLAAGVLEGLSSPWRLVLDQVPPDDLAVRALQSRLGATMTPGEGMPTVRVTSREPGHYLSRNSRKALAKTRNRLAADGLEPELTWTSDEASIRAVLPEMAAVHRARDADLGRRSDHEDPRAAAFYERVISVHAARGEVDLLTLRLRGELAAFVCGFVDGRALRSWDNRLNPVFSRWSAGRLANTEALLHVVGSDRYDELDWMQGEEPYKMQSATEVVPRAVLHAWSGASVRRAHELVEGARRAKRRHAGLGRAWNALQDARTAVRRAG